MRSESEWGGSPRTGSQDKTGYSEMGVEEGHNVRGTRKISAFCEDKNSF